MKLRPQAQRSPEQTGAPRCSSVTVSQGIPCGEEWAQRVPQSEPPGYQYSRVRLETFELCVPMGPVR